MSFHVEYQFYLPSVKKYPISFGVVEYSSALANKFQHSTKVYAIFGYCSAAPQSIKMG